MIMLVLLFGRVVGRAKVNVYMKQLQTKYLYLLHRYRGVG